MKSWSSMGDPSNVSSLDLGACIICAHNLKSCACGAEAIGVGRPGGMLEVLVSSLMVVGFELTNCDGTAFEVEGCGDTGLGMAGLEAFGDWTKTWEF